jgi:hypothetical protein
MPMQAQKGGGERRSIAPTPSVTSAFGELRCQHHVETTQEGIRIFCTLKNKPNADLHAKKKQCFSNVSSR